MVGPDTLLAYVQLGSNDEILKTARITKYSMNQMLSGQPG